MTNESPRGTNLRVSEIKEKKKDNFNKLINFFNLIFDFFLKGGSLLTAFSLLISLYYIKLIGFSELAASTVFSGFASVLFAFGFAFFIFLCLVIPNIIPWIAFFIKKCLIEFFDVDKNFVEKLFSIWNFLLMLLIPSTAFLILTAYPKAATYDEVFGSIYCIWTITFIVFYWKRLGLAKAFIVTIAITYIAYFSLFLLLCWIVIVDNIDFIKQQGDSIEILAVFLLNLIYALIAYFGFKAIDKNGWRGVVAVLMFFSSIIFGFTIISFPKNSDLFITRVAQIGGIRQYQNQATWRYIDKSEHFKLKLAGNVSGIKNVGKEKYFCSYSILSLGDQNILCPFDVSQPNAKTCFAFESKKVSIVPVPDTAEWHCGAQK